MTLVNLLIDKIERVLFITADLPIRQDIYEQLQPGISDHGKPKGEECFMRPVPLGTKRDKQLPHGASVRKTFIVSK